MNQHYNGERDGDGVWEDGEWIPDDIPFTDDDGDYIEMDIPEDASEYDDDGE